MSKILELKTKIEKERKIQRKKVGESLAYYRNAVDMTQQQLAEDLGIERTSITNIESGKQNVTLELFLLLCSYFEITPNDFLKGLY